MKKFFLLVVLFLFTLIFFSAKLIGLSAQLFLKLKGNYEFTYRCCEWEKGQLTFSEIHFLSPRVQAKVKKASVGFDWSSFPKKLKGHLTLDAPELGAIQDWFFPEHEIRWFECSISATDGVLDGKKKTQFRFSHQQDCSELFLNWDDGSVHFRQENGLLEASLDHFDLAFLKNWIPHGIVSSADLSGRVQISTEGELIAANLKVLAGSFVLPKGSIEEVRGAISYNASVGAKWELDGLAKMEREPFAFSCQGRGFQGRWIESEIHFEKSCCKISGDEIWAFECEHLQSFELSWLQAAFSIFYPKLLQWEIKSGDLSAKGSFGPSSWTVHFDAQNLNLLKETCEIFCLEAVGDLSQEGGSFIAKNSEGELKFDGTWGDWGADLQFQNGLLSLRGGVDGEKFPIEIIHGRVADLQFQGSGWIDSRLDVFFSLEGTWQFLRQNIPFYCPILSKQGNDWAFDFRLSRKTWDFFRFAGNYDGEQIVYQKTSHLFSEPIHFVPSPKDEINASVTLPLKTIFSAMVLFEEWGIDVKKLPLLEHLLPVCQPSFEKEGQSVNADLCLQYKSNQLDFKAALTNFPLTFHATQVAKEWDIELISDLRVSAHLSEEGIVKGRGRYKEFFDTQFEGKIDPSYSTKLFLSNTKLDLKMISGLSIEGEALGGGHFIYNKGIEADFDFSVSSLIIHSFPLENEGQIHLSYKPQEGISIQGLQLHGELDCVVDLLQYDPRSHWIFHNAQIHLPPTFLSHPLLQALDKGKDLNMIADLDFASDFSTLVCKMQEGFIPYGGAYHRIENLELSWKESRCQGAFYYLEHFFRIDLQVKDGMKGRLSVGQEALPLSIDWEYRKGLLIQAIEGSFSGLEASFHAQSPNVLVGSARCNFKTLQEIFPSDVARVFQEIQMGQGYELKGLLKIENRVPHFIGILSGKAIELFGFQFKTLLAQVDLSPQVMRIYDIKISDLAGMMKIDEILLQDNHPWRISIPNLTLLEIRPSLLQRPGAEIGMINPLVIRELKIANFKGILDDAKTYTAKGSLHFINSYKRQETVFDLPANVLSRIVGLDFDLLIPVTGDLTFEMKDGYFNLLELKNAYSEGRRSEFFLEMDPVPRMSLDGNLQIYIKMKQFVLLKITESFLISIDGALSDPQYRLKRKRFFGFL